MPGVIAAACSGRPTLEMAWTYIYVVIFMLRVTSSHDIVVGTTVLPLLDDRCINMVSMSMSPGVITQDGMVQQMRDNCVDGMANFNKTDTNVTKTVNGSNHTFIYTSSVTAESMSTVRLLCRVDNIPFTTDIVHWYIIPDGTDGERISTDGRRVSKFTRMEPKFDIQNGIYDLIIFNATVNDTSTYKCFFNLPESIDLISKLIVNKTGLISIKKITSDTKQGVTVSTKRRRAVFNYETGKDAQLDCDTDQIRGDPFFHVGWGREGAPIKYFDGNYSFISGKTLLLPKLNYSDAGRYYCETRNSFGKDYLMIDIGVD
ncbi:junctional adhesion molecule 3B-like isoform X2 [Antedon mediterranea]|uniref:junctional adhesion molecule 3B-like isoform X2 n=1 Tax=Antedon mediterranea TaxID=105859 RepID=UPI003AF908BC